MLIWGFFSIRHANTFVTCVHNTYNKSFFLATSNIRALQQPQNNRMMILER